MSIVDLRLKKIDELEARILKLQKIYKDDVRESYREAAQTQEQIEQLKAQLISLENEKSVGMSSKRYLLKNMTSGETRELKIVSSNPDRTIGEISSSSPVGKILTSARLNDVISIAGQEYQIVE